MSKLSVLRQLGQALILAAGLTAAGAAGAEPKPDLVLTGEIGPADLHTYREAAFETPPGVTRLTVRFAQDGATQHTTIDLGLLDPQGFRGWSGGNKTGFTVSATDATPSYLAGPIIPGEWRLLMGVPNIRPGVVTHYQASIYFERAGARPAVSSFSDAPLKTGARWYRGDLHDHTAHSDGSCASRGGKKVPCPAFLTVEAAERRGLDFVAVSDHNTVSHMGDLRELQPYFDDVLLIPAREITTFQGHANAFGGTAFIDFRLDGEHVANADDLIAGAHRAGALFSINHPGSPSGEICMGCGWTAPVANPAAIDAVEVVNGGSSRAAGGRPDGFGSHIPFWQKLLAQGLRPTAVGGSDNHAADAPVDAVQGLGAPTTVVYAPELSERAILDAVKAGHVFIDVEGTRERLLETWAGSGAGRAMMGDQAELSGGGVDLEAHVAGVPGGRIEWIHDDGLRLDVAEALIGADETRRVRATAAGGRHWVYVTVRDAAGRLVLLGNPIYLRGR